MQELFVLEYIVQDSFLYSLEDMNLDLDLLLDILQIHLNLGHLSIYLDVHYSILIAMVVLHLVERFEFDWELDFLMIKECLERILKL